MTKKYIMTSGSFTGSVIFGFDDEGRLTFYHNESGMNAKQSSWLFARFPFTEEHLHSLQPIIKGRLELVPEDTSFDAFWNRYRHKINRKRCEPLWKKLNETERIECLMSITSYDNYLKRTQRGKLDPENYLKRGAWENKWNQINA